MSEPSEEVHRETIRDTVLHALRACYGPDNAAPMEHDPFHLGVVFPDGDFVNVYIAAERG